jgi:phosphoglycolate phosphatase
MERALRFHAVSIGGWLRADCGEDLMAGSRYGKYMIPRFRGILFDKDGTLLDFEATWAPIFRSLALELADGDPAVAHELLLAGGLDPLSGRMQAGSVLGAGTTHDIVRVWYPSLSGAPFQAMAERIDARFHAHGADGSVAVPELIATLATLTRAGYALGVATNDGTEAARMALSGVGALAYLPHIFGYDSVARPKPAGDIVHAFAAAIGASPPEVAVVGDNLHDLDMARAAGAGAAIGVLTGNSSREDLAPHADAVLASIRDLPVWLNGDADQFPPVSGK